MQEVRGFQATGPTHDQLAHVRALYMRKYEAQLKDNLFWLVGLTYYLQNGLNLEDILCIPDIWAAITPEIVKDSASQYLSLDSLLTAKMYPENGAQ